MLDLILFQFFFASSQEDVSPDDLTLSPVLIKLEISKQPQDNDHYLNVS